MTTPIKTKTYFVQILLIVMSVMSILLGMLLFNKTVYFFPCVQTVTAQSNTILQIGPGQISLAHAGIFLGFLLIYLLFEFYSFKPAFYTVLCTAFATITCFILLKVLHIYILRPDMSQMDSLLSQTFLYNRRDIVATTLAMTLGLSVTLFFAASIKRLTHNYLMFIRFPIASLIGFGVFTAVLIYITQFQTLAIPSMITAGMTPYSQFAALIIAAVVPLYVLRLFLSIFRGRVPKEKQSFQETSKKEKTGSPGFFKPATDAVMPTSTTETIATPSGPILPDSVNKNEPRQPPQIS